MSEGRKLCGTSESGCAHWALFSIRRILRVCAASFSALSTQLHLAGSKMPALLRHFAAEAGALHGTTVVALPGGAQGPRLQVLVEGDRRKPPSTHAQVVDFDVQEDHLVQHAHAAAALSVGRSLRTDEGLTHSVLWPSANGAPRSVLLVLASASSHGVVEATTTIVDVATGAVTELWSTSAGAVPPGELLASRWPPARRHAAACVVLKPTAPAMDSGAPVVVSPLPVAAAPEPVDPKAKQAGKPGAKEAKPGAGSKAAAAALAAEAGPAAPPASSPASSPAVALNFPLMLMFGGLDIVKNEPCNDLYALHMDNEAVAQSCAEQAGGKAGDASGAAHHAGEGEGVAKKPLWLKVRTASAGPTPGPRVHHSLTGTGSGSRAVLFGGHGVSSSPVTDSHAGHGAAPPPSLLNDAWVLDCVSWTWTCLLTTGIPPVPRFQHCTASNAFLPDRATLEARPWQLAVPADMRAILPVYRTMAATLSQYPGETGEAELELEGRPKPPSPPPPPSCPRQQRWSRPLLPPSERGARRRRAGPRPPPRRHPSLKLRLPRRPSRRRPPPAR